jgi:hypothetical protein
MPSTGGRPKASTLRGYGQGRTNSTRGKQKDFIANNILNLKPKLNRHITMTSRTGGISDHLSTSFAS